MTLAFTKLTFRLAVRHFVDYIPRIQKARHCSQLCRLQDCSVHTSRTDSKNLHPQAYCLFPLSTCKSRSTPREYRQCGKTYIYFDLLPLFYTFSAPKNNIEIGFHVSYFAAHVTYPKYHCYISAVLKSCYIFVFQHRVETRVTSNFRDISTMAKHTFFG